MLEALAPLSKAVFVVPITLLPIINPLSAAPVFVATVGPRDDAIVRLARQVAVNAFFVIAASMLVGTYVLEFFGISLPVVRVGGGLLVASAGWRMLHSGADDEVRDAAARQAIALSEAEVQQRSFFPLTFPLLTGPGTVAASIALGAQLPNSPVQYLLHVAVALIGAAMTAAVIYLSSRHAAAVLRRMGPLGTMVMMRLAAFILLCIGIDMLWAGYLELSARR